ncbi:MAG: right-handed parallel beta-helix repeat-containing protein [Deltaproteobacteria bacterium]
MRLPCSFGVLSAAVVGASCGNPAILDDGGVDAGRSDATPVDAGARDAGIAIDRDGGVGDAGRRDGGTRDGGAERDAGIPVVMGPGGTATARFPMNGADWNDWVVGDAALPLEASDVACDPTNPDRPEGCVHAGPLRRVDTRVAASCADVHIDDVWGWFDWSCEDAGGTIVACSTGLRAGVGLSAMVDLDRMDWLPAYVRVEDRATQTELGRSPWGVWWSNPITTTAIAPGAIYVQQTSTSTVVEISEPNVAFVTAPGVTLSAPESSAAAILVDAPFAWVEADIDASGLFAGVRVDAPGFSIVRRTKVTGAELGARGTGVNVQGHHVRIVDSEMVEAHEHGVFWAGNYGWMERVLTRDGDREGIRLRGRGQRVRDVAATGNALYGLFIANGGAELRIEGVVATGNGGRGVQLGASGGVEHVYLRDVVAANNGGSLVNGGGENVAISFSDGAVVANVTAADGMGNNTTGVLVLADNRNNALLNVAAANHSDRGVYLSGGSVVALSREHLMLGVASSNNDTGIEVSRVADATFLGRVKVGSNLGRGDCLATVPRGIDAMCMPEGESDFVLETGLDLTNAFVDRARGDYALVSTDTGLLDVNRVPTGADYFAYPFRPTLGASDQATCDAAYPGSTWDGAESCDVLALRSAVEDMFDGVGNDNVLCESGEACLYTPNLGTYQGHGLLLDVPFAEGSTITGIRLRRYESNGY